MARASWHTVIDLVQPHQDLPEIYQKYRKWHLKTSFWRSSQRKTYLMDRLTDLNFSPPQRRDIFLVRVSPLTLSDVSLGITESENHRMLRVGRDLCGSSSPTLLPKQGHLQHAAQDLVQAGLEYLQRRRLHNLPGQPVPVLCHPQSEEVLPHVQTEHIIN